jgi:hypothetical protein
MNFNVRLRKFEADPNTPMRSRAPDWTLTGVGALTAAAGLYFCLVGLSLLPPPSKINGPIWLALSAGLAFFAAGFSVLMRGLSGADDGSDDLPNDVPAWMKTVYWLDSVIAPAGLAGVATWIAFGGGTRQFSMSGPIVGPIGEGIGRTVFGIGAIITWLMVIALARSGVRKIFGKKS